MVTVSPGFFEKIYDDAIPGLTVIQSFFLLSHGGVAILTFNIISFPSAGKEAIEYALSTVSLFFMLRGHRLKLSHSNLNFLGSSGCSFG